jgi:hypothetical protein
MLRATSAFLLALCVVFALAATSAPAITQPQKFSLLEIDESDASTNLGFDFQRFPRPGDQFAFKSSLYKWAGAKRGVRVGHDEGVCTFIRVPPETTQGFSATGHCAAGIHLPLGELVLEGFIEFTDGPSRFDVPIVGGTGAYANARGYVHIRDVGGEDSGHSAMTFHLTP